MTQVQVGTQTSQGAAVEWQIRWLQADPQSTIRLADERARELHKRTQQIVHIIRVCVVADQTIGEPGLGIVGGHPDHIGDQLPLQSRFLGECPQTAQWNTSGQAPQVGFDLVELHLERLDLAHQRSTRGRRQVQSPSGLAAWSIRSRRLVRVQHQCPA